MRPFWVPALGLLASCAFLDEILVTTPTDTVTDEVGATGDTGQTTKKPKVPAEPELAGGIRISKVSAYQAVERPLWVDREPASTDVPLVAEREALVRVFVEPLATWKPRRVRVELSVVDDVGKPIVELDQRMRVDVASTDADPDSSFNFVIAGADLPLDAELHVEIREVSVDAPGEGGERRTVFDSALDLPGGLPLEPGEDIELVIFPIRYTADGSNRLPDTTDLTMQRLRERFEAMYPVRSATITLAGINDWSSPILADGTGWDTILYALSQTRDAEKESPNTYYYALFNPADSFAAYCGYSCTVGLSNLAFSASYPFLRASVGVGFTEYGISGETFVHEVGHAHGRYHAPCGGPAQVDPDYPYSGAGIGAWGYDRRSGTLVDPSGTLDMMGYCDPIWLSDYTYTALFDRIALVQTRPRSITQLVSRFRVNGEGEVLDQDLVRLEGVSGAGIPVWVEPIDETGVAQPFVQGWMMPWSHLPGGVVTLDQALPDGWTAAIR